MRILPQRTFPAFLLTSQHPERGDWQDSPQVWNRRPAVPLGVLHHPVGCFELITAQPEEEPATLAYAKFPSFPHDDMLLVS